MKIDIRRNEVKISVRLYPQKKNETADVSQWEENIYGR